MTDRALSGELAFLNALRLELCRVGLPAIEVLAVKELHPAGLLGRNRSKRHLVNVNAFLRTHKQCARIGNAPPFVNTEARRLSLPVKDCLLVADQHYLFTSDFNDDRRRAIYGHKLA